MALLVAVLAVAGALAAVLVLRGGRDDGARRAQAPAPTATPAPSPAPTAAPSPTPAPRPERPAEGLAIGITEPNPNFVWPQEAKPGVPPAFDRWRDVLDGIRPSIYRLVVEWGAVQPAQGASPAWDQPQHGCMRRRRPCAGWQGVREQLRAVRAQRQARADGRWEVLLVLAGTPGWAARGAGGCEREDVAPRSRRLRDGALGDYRAFVRAIDALAREEGVEIRYWSPWNEPNHPYGLSPQRPRCDASAPSASARHYARLAGAMAEALRDGQELVLGEAAGLTRRTVQATTVRELVDGLPKRLLCRTRVWSQHAYVGGRDPVGDVRAALEDRGCERRHEVWITETGAGGARLGAQRDATPAAEAATCDRLHERLRRWHRDPQVTAAVQYTLREDDRFPTGLVSTNLRRAYPALGLLRAWGGRRDPADAPPANAC